METPQTVYTAVKDSGARQAFTTGSVRDTQEGKGRFDLISPIALERIAKHYENGAKKYGDRNWEKGQPLGRYLDSALRHINKFREGHRDEDHLCAAIWNLMGIIHTESQILRGNLPAELNDLVGYLPKPQSPQEPVLVARRVTEEDRRIAEAGCAIAEQFGHSMARRRDAEFAQALAEASQRDDGDTHEGSLVPCGVIVEKAEDGEWDILSPCRRFYWGPRSETWVTRRRRPGTKDREVAGMFPRFPDRHHILRAQAASVPTT